MPLPGIVLLSRSYTVFAKTRRPSETCKSSWYLKGRFSNVQMKKKLSIHDIAKALKVSASTISFVLNNKAEEKRISESVRERVLKYVEEVGYKPNVLAQSLRTGKSKILGMLVEDISDSFFSRIARTAELLAAKNGYKILFSSTENDTAKTKSLLKLMRERQVEGYIIAPPPGIETDLHELLHEKIPVVLFDRYFADIPTHNIEINNAQGATLAAAHFIENNYCNIGFITLDSTQTQMAARLRGYTNALNDHGLPLCVLKAPYNLDEEMIIKAVTGFLTAHPLLDAVLFATNYLTVGGLKAIQQMGLGIPDNIAIIGFDDNPHFSILSPPVTAVVQPVQQIAEVSVGKLMEMLSGRTGCVSESNIVLPVKLEIRASSMPVKRSKLSLATDEK